MKSRFGFSAFPVTGAASNLPAFRYPSACPASFAPAAISETKFQGFILGVDLPGPHTVLATPDGWWSWGEPWCPWCDFPDAVIEEAWVVSWR